MKFFLLPVFLLVAGLYSCSYQKLEFEKKSGKTNVVKAGEIFCISLPEDHKTKYYWGVTHDYNKKVLSYITSSFHGKTVAFNFETIAKGKTKITFFLYSYRDTSQTKTFVVEVE